MWWKARWSAPPTTLSVTELPEAIRVHSFSDSRLVSNDDDLQGYLTFLADVLGALRRSASSERLILLRTTWSETESSREAALELPPWAKRPVLWKSVRTTPEPWAIWTHTWASKYEEMSSRDLNYILARVAYEEEEDVAVLDLRSDWIVRPYHGGADAAWYGVSASELRRRVAGAVQS